MTPSLTLVRDRSAFAAAIRRARKELGWTQADLARKAGLVTHHVSRLETGASDPKLSTLLSVLAALGNDVLIAPRGAHLGLQGLPVAGDAGDLGVEGSF